MTTSSSDRLAKQTGPIGPSGVLRSALTDRELTLGRVGVGALVACFVMVIYLLASLVLPAISLGTVLAKGQLVGVVILGLAICVAVIAFQRRSRARADAARVLAAGDAQFCPCCAYPLKELEEVPGPCPECAAWIESRAWVRVYWDALYGRLMRSGKGNEQ